MQKNVFTFHHFILARILMNMNWQIKFVYKSNRLSYNFFLLNQIDSIRTALEKNPSLRVVVLLDYLRGLRTDNPKEKSTSKTMFLPLIEKYSSQLDFYLFHTPLLYGFLRKIIPTRYNESWGVQHMKIYMADNNLIISG